MHHQLSKKTTQHTYRLYWLPRTGTKFIKEMLLTNFDIDLRSRAKHTPPPIGDGSIKFYTLRHPYAYVKSYLEYMSAPRDTIDCPVNRFNQIAPYYIDGIIISYEKIIKNYKIVLKNIWKKLWLTPAYKFVWKQIQQNDNTQPMKYTYHINPEATPLLKEQKNYVDKYISRDVYYHLLGNSE